MGETGANAARSQISVRDIEDQSPIKLLIDKRKDLKLTDAQLAQLKDAESKLKDKNASLLRIVDSVNKEMRPSLSGTPSDDDRAKMMSARKELMGVIQDIRDNYDASLKEVVPTLDEEQQKKAGELLAKQREELDRKMQSRMGRSPAP